MNITMNEQDRKYAQGASRGAFRHSQFYIEAVCDEDRANAAYHKREIVAIAKWLEAGLTKIAASNPKRIEL